MLTKWPQPKAISFGFAKHIKQALQKENRSRYSEKFNVSRVKCYCLCIKPHLLLWDVVLHRLDVLREFTRCRRIVVFDNFTRRAKRLSLTSYFLALSDWIFLLFIKSRKINLKQKINIKKSFVEAYSVGTRAWVALYWKGISMRAESANAASFFSIVMFPDMIFVKFTNCIILLFSLLKTSFSPQHIYKFYDFVAASQSREAYPKAETNRHYNIGELSCKYVFYLKVVKWPPRNKIIELLHRIPRTVTDANHNDRKRIVTASIIGIRKFRK